MVDPHQREVIGQYRHADQNGIAFFRGLAKDATTHEVEGNNPDLTGEQATNST